jgi:hypothetical protein
VLRLPLALTDEDLCRLARLGGSVEGISEAAGIEPHDVRRRLAALDADLPTRTGDASMLPTSAEAAASPRR